ncbi:hypothetical protein R6Q59_024025 [Mikania micrantha]
MRCQLQTLARIVSVVRTYAGGRRPSSKAITCTMSAKSTGLMFQLKVNPISGNSEWIVIEEIDDVSPEPMLATTSYLDMLNDSPRNRAYRSIVPPLTELFPNTVMFWIFGMKSHRHRKSYACLSVIENTGPLFIFGPGLLSMMTARAMSGDDLSSSKGMITACESYILTMKLMKKVLHENNMNHKIRVFNKKSYELEVGVDIASRADVLVSEILDSELLGEGLIPTLQHAHDKLLVENYKTLMESTYLWKLHDLFNNEVDVDDGIHLVPKERRVFCESNHNSLPCIVMHWVKKFDWYLANIVSSLNFGEAPGIGVTSGNSVFGLQKEKSKGQDSPLCVIADDSVFLSVAVVHVAKASHVISLFSGLGDKGSQYLQAVADENGYSMDRVQAVNTRKSQLTMNDTHQNKIPSLSISDTQTRNFRHSGLRQSDQRCWKQGVKLLAEPIKNKYNLEYIQWLLKHILIHPVVSFPSTTDRIILTLGMFHVTRVYNNLTPHKNPVIVNGLSILFVPTKTNF